MVVEYTEAEIKGMFVIFDEARLKMARLQGEVNKKYLALKVDRATIWTERGLSLGKTVEDRKHALLLETAVQEYEHSDLLAQLEVAKAEVESIEWKLRMVKHG